MKTLRLRLKDKHCKVLDQLAREVNFVWNYVNDLGVKYLKRHKKFLSAYDLHKYTKGASKEGLNIHSQTIQAINEEYALRRKQFKKSKLRWRVSGGSRKSLGWIPFKSSAISYKNGQIKYGEYYFGLWDSYGLSKFTFKTGSFSQDSRGRWYFNVCVDSKSEKSPGKSSVGIDLGLKDFATISDGSKVSAEKIYRNYENKLAKAQRANKKRLVKSIHAKIKNKRNDSLHKLSTKLVKNNAAIFVGNVNAKALAKTKMAKSVLDASWSIFRTMLKYKCDDAGVLFEEVNEKFTTQTCSSCGVIPCSSPKGLIGLNKRMWACSSCGSIHDRDHNSAINILRLGHQTLAGGIPVL